MLNPSWKTRLNQTLTRLRESDPAPRVAVVGIGHELNGDDAAGLAVACGLAARWPGMEHLRAIDAGPAPENQTGPLRAFRPALIVFVDAAQMDDPPGTVRWLDWQDVAGLSACTHILPLPVLARYLIAELGCAIALIGIQPQRNLFDTPLSPAVSQAVADVIETVAAELPS